MESGPRLCRGPALPDGEALDGYTKTLNSTTGWNYSWTGLPASSGGTSYTYAAHEIAMGVLRRFDDRGDK